jgi:WD40 repeat protein
VAERAWKRCRRRPLVAGLMVGLSAAVLVAVVLPSVFWKQAEAGRERELGLRQAAEEREARLLLKTARLQWLDSDLDGARESLAGCDEAHRNVEWKYLWRMCRPPHMELQARGSMDETMSFTTALKYTPDGSGVFAAFREKILRSWDATTGRELISFTSPRVIKGIAALTSNEALITFHWFTPGPMGKPTINLAAFDPTSNALRPVWTTQQNPTPLAISPDGGTAAYRPRPRSLVVFDVQTGGQLWQLNGVWFNDTGVPEISGDGRRIVARMEEWKEEVFELRTGKLVGTIHIPKSVGASLVAINRNASQAAFSLSRSGRSHDLIVCGAGSHDTEVRVRTPFQFAPMVQFSPDGRLLAACGQGPGYVGVWDAQTGAEVVLLRGHRDRVQCIAFSPDSKRLAVGDSGGRVAIWDVTADE